jgi:hypothetical protein
MVLSLLDFNVVLMLLLVWLEEDEENTNDEYVQDTNNNSGLLSPCGHSVAWGNSVSSDFSLLAIYTNFFLLFIVRLSCFH